LQSGGRGEGFKPFQGQAFQIHLLTPFFWLTLSGSPKRSAYAGANLPLAQI
jgi:hypothetical protein